MWKRRRYNLRHHRHHFTHNLHHQGSPLIELANVETTSVVIIIFVIVILIAIIMITIALFSEKKTLSSNDNAMSFGQMRRKMTEAENKTSLKGIKEASQPKSPKSPFCLFLQQK